MSLFAAWLAGTLLALSESKGRRKAAPDLISIWPAVERVHTRAGELMAKHWDLPPDIQLAIANHHQVMIGGQPHPLSGAIALANEMAHFFGLGVLPKEGAALEEMSEVEADCIRSYTTIDKTGAKTLIQAREALSLDEKTLGLIREESEQALERLGLARG